MAKANKMKAQEAPDAIDARVHPLVEAMNRIPGLKTHCSCGGHRNGVAREVGRVPPSEYRVAFRVARSARGMDALERLADALDQAVSLGEHVGFNVFGPPLHFEIHGYGDADPEALASLIDRTFTS